MITRRGLAVAFMILPALVLFRVYIGGASYEKHKESVHTDLLVLHKAYMEAQRGAAPRNTRSKLKIRHRTLF